MATWMAEDCHGYMDYIKAVQRALPVALALHPWEDSQLA